MATVSVHAGTITLTALPATGTDAATGINSTNTYICCLGYGSTAGNVTVNGVTFTHESLSGAATRNGTDPIHGGSWTLTANHNLGSTTGGPVGAASQADGSMASLLAGPVYVTSSAPVNSWLSQNYGGLTPGAQYAFRLYYRQWATSPARNINIVYNGEGSNEVYSANPLNEDAGGAAYIEYDFTAATNYVLMLMTNLIANESAMAYGISIQQTAAAPSNTAPSISLEPVGITNWAGFSGVLSVSATGTPAPTYQWYQNNSLLSGQTNLSLNFASLVTSNSGSYYVTVSNIAGVTNSTVTIVDVLVGTNVIVSNTLSQVQLPATGTDTATGIGTGSNYLCVLDFGSAGSTYSGAVNGVNFTPVALTPNATNQSGVDPNYGGTWNVTTTGPSGFANGNPNGATSSVTWQADGNMQSVLTPSATIIQNGFPTQGATITFNFGGLSLGGQYALRYYYRQWETNDYPPRPVLFTFNGNGTNINFQTDEEVGGAYYFEYDFAATTNGVLLTLTDESGQVNLANWPPLIYAITLQQTAAGPPTAPIIFSQPVGFTNWAGLNGSLSVTASGSPSPTYQWYQNNSPLIGATGPMLSFTPLATTNVGSYYVVVSNTTGATNSSVVMVGVLSGTNVISPTLSQVQLPASGTDTATGIGTTNFGGTNYLLALDFGVSAYTGQVNGITFTPVNLATNSPQSGTDPNYGGTWTVSTTDTNGFRDVNGGGVPPGNQADGSMANVLLGASYVGVAPVATAVAFNFGVLDPGAQYLLCYYFRQYDAGDSPVRPVQFAFNGNGINATTLIDEDLGGAYYVAYQFTAASNAVSMVLTDESAVVNQGPMIYAVTLQMTEPVLNYSLSGTSLTLSWNTNLTSYALESATNLPAASWTLVPGVVNNSVTVSATGGPMYFRLQQTQ